MHVQLYLYMYARGLLFFLVKRTLISLSFFVFAYQDDLLMCCVWVHVCRWPAMIEEDPDEETYYEMSRKTNKLSPVSSCMQSYIQCI